MVRGYARVSSKGQEKYGNGLETQTSELKAAGAEIIYTDAYTGAKCSRPNFDKLLAELEPNDTLMVTKLDMGGQVPSMPRCSGMVAAYRPKSG